MKLLVLIILAILTGCATHPNNITPVNNSIPVDCSRVEELYTKQEISFAGDIILVSLIGLPLMPSYEKELSELRNCY